MEIFGIKFIGANAENGQKLLLTISSILIILLVGYLLRKLAGIILGSEKLERAKFWTRQGISLFMAILLIMTVMSIWFDDPTRLTTAFGLVTAGLAFALQKVVTSIAGYFVILRGRNFTIGDRISMGGVRGDVIGLGFIQTTIMEMGQPPAVQEAALAVWVKSRQFTGRIVTVANSTIFDEPVFNYTRDFPFIWEEITIPITYEDKREKAEEIMLLATNNHVLKTSELSEEAVKKLEDLYFVNVSDFDPKVFYRITDNWLELTIRFIVSEHKVREVKNDISRDILEGFDAEGIGIASATYDIVGFPPIQIEDSRNGGNPKLEEKIP
ncbi:MAG: mechanosensitive ion channel family protein [Acidobacteriota bacterium]|jgi:small-conductance mechanosensitive channel|nr:mechanosensitive ion channel family protein [Acidobacteriota bacterium]